MRVRSTEAVGAQAGDRGTVPLRPAATLPRNLEPELRPGDVRIQRLAVETRRNLAMVQTQGELDHSRRRGAGLEVAEVRLHGSEKAGTIHRAAAAQHSPERACFDAIAGDGSGAVRLHITDVRH